MQNGTTGRKQTSRINVSLFGVSLFGVWLLLNGLIGSGVVTAYGAEVIDRIVAVVNNEIITLSDLNHALKPYLTKIKQFGYSQDKERQLLTKTREDILQGLVDRKLADQEIKQANIRVGESELDDTIENIKKERLFTDEDFKQVLNRQGLTMGAYRQQIKEQILRAKIINLEVKSKIAITQEDIKAYYEKHKDQYAGKNKYHLRHIIMAIPPFADENTKKNIHTKMEMVLAKLKQGEAFEALARKYSESPLAAEGGDLGVFELDQLSPEIKRGVSGKGEGEFTSILETEQGYQVFYIEKVILSKGKSVEEVAPEIQEKIYNKIVDTKFQAWMESLRLRSHIRIIR